MGCLSLPHVRSFPLCASLCPSPFQAPSRLSRTPFRQRQLFWAHSPPWPAPRRPCARRQSPRRPGPPARALWRARCLLLWGWKGERRSERDCDDTGQRQEVVAARKSPKRRKQTPEVKGGDATKVRQKQSDRRKVGREAGAGARSMSGKSAEIKRPGRADTVVETEAGVESQ